MWLKNKDIFDPGLALNVLLCHLQKDSRTRQRLMKIQEYELYQCLIIEKGEVYAPHTAILPWSTLNIHVSSFDPRRPFVATSKKKDHAGQHQPLRPPAR